jgi:hypothetical protein
MSVDLADHDATYRGVHLLEITVAVGERLDAAVCQLALKVLQRIFEAVVVELLSDCGQHQRLRPTPDICLSRQRHGLPRCPSQTMDCS